MHELAPLSKVEKNKLYTDSTALVLLEIQLTEGTVYIVRNTSDIDWHGQHWIAFPFDIGAVNESTDGSDPTVDLLVEDVKHTITASIERSGGGVGTTVILRVINTASASDNTDADVTEEFVVQSAVLKQEGIKFRLGTEYSARTRRPLDRYLKDTCRYQYKGCQCGYTGSMASCKKTLADCRLHGNSERFGAFPGIDQKGIYV